VTRLSACIPPPSNAYVSVGWHAAIASRPLQWGLLEQLFTHAMCIPPRGKEQGRKFFLRFRLMILDIARVHCQGAWFGASCDSQESRIDRLDIAFPQLWHSVNPRERNIRITCSGSPLTSCFAAQVRQLRHCRKLSLR